MPYFKVNLAVGVPSKGYVVVQRASAKTALALVNHFIEEGELTNYEDSIQYLEDVPPLRALDVEALPNDHNLGNPINEGNFYCWEN